jgi:hypothetical protein
MEVGFRKSVAAHPYDRQVSSTPSWNLSELNPCGAVITTRTFAQGALVLPICAAFQPAGDRRRHPRAQPHPAACCSTANLHVVRTICGCFLAVLISLLN